MYGLLKYHHNMTCYEYICPVADPSRRMFNADFLVEVRYFTPAYYSTHVYKIRRRHGIIYMCTWGHIFIALLRMRLRWYWFRYVHVYRCIFYIHTQTHVHSFFRFFDFIILVWSTPMSLKIHWSSPFGQ